MSDTWKNKVFTASNIISAVALIASIFSFIMSYQASMQESIRVRKEELRKVLSDLIDARKNFRENLRSGGTPFFDLYTEKRLIYFSAAENIIAEIPSHVSWAEYNTLAKEAFTDDNFEKSIYYLEQANKSARSLQARVYTLNALAQFYFADSPVKNYETARSYYKKSIALLETQRDPHYLMIIADTYRGWGVK